VRQAGGLHVIGTRTHESRRWTTQLALPRRPPGGAAGLCTRWVLPLAEDNLPAPSRGNSGGPVLMNASGWKRTMPVSESRLQCSPASNSEEQQKGRKLLLRHPQAGVRVRRSDEQPSAGRVWPTAAVFWRPGAECCKVIGYGERTMDDVVEAYVNPDCPSEEWVWPRAGLEGAG